MRDSWGDDDFSSVERRKSGRTQYRVTSPGKLIFSVILILAILAGAIWGAIRLFGGGDNPIAILPTKTLEPEIPQIEFQTPEAVEATRPSKWGFSFAMEIDGQNVTAQNYNGDTANGYKRSNAISFGRPEEYTQLEGIVTFRGNNFRNSASYGTASISSKTFDSESRWQVNTASLPKAGGVGSWTGSGWVGQPLIVKWPKDTKAAMSNMKQKFKDDDSFVEVILATMDGKVYFLDLETGEPSRDSHLNIGMAFKGAGSIDPSGIPILYLGAGDNLPNKESRAYIYSLTDFEKLLEFGTRPDPFSSRSFHAYDSSALIDAKTNTMIYPGENGILYTMNINPSFNKETGKVSISPTENVKWKYTAKRIQNDKGGSTGNYWYGMEDSAAAYKNYVYIADNAGFIQCIDINTMQCIWVQDIKDDTNGSPVFELSEDGENGYLYIAPSLHFTATNGAGEVSIYKLDASSGEIIWEAPYKCHTVNGVSGGVQATIAIGKKGSNIEDYIIVPVARTPNTSDGILVALDKETGKEVWKTPISTYPWSSPVAVYDENNNAYIVQANGRDKVHLVDGKTGTILDSIDLGETTIEASPAVYGNTVVIGTRSGRIFGFKIK